MNHFHYYLQASQVQEILAFPRYGQYYFRRQVDGGLVHNSFTSIIQDPKGLTVLCQDQLGAFTRSKLRLSVHQ